MGTHDLAYTDFTAKMPSKLKFSARAVGTWWHALAKGPDPVVTAFHRGMSR
jgi:hypothetical protein